MSGQLFQLVAKRVLKDTAKKNINSKDPYYEEVAIYGRDGRPTGKVKKQKKGIPNTLSHNDANVLKKVRKRAFRLDMCLFNCCGIRFGWSSVIGFIPVVGDIIDLFFAWLLVRACSNIDGGLPSIIQYRMYFNIILDFGIGLVPFVGDIADAVFRANTRNAWILEEYLIKRADAVHVERQEQDGGRPEIQHNPQSNDGHGALPSYGPGIGPISIAGTGQAPEKSPARGPETSHDYGHEMGVIGSDKGQSSYNRK